MPATRSPEQPALVRGLGLPAAASIVIGNVIGGAIFLKPRVMICNVGSPTWVIVIWIAAGLLSLAGALTIAELAAMMPRAGGIYVYLREAFGRRLAFLYGWVTFVIGTAGLSGIGAAFAIFANALARGALDDRSLSLHLVGLHGTVTAVQLVAAAAIAAIALLNCAAIRVGGMVSTILTGIKLVVVVGLTIGAFAFADSGTFDHLGTTATNGTCEGVASTLRGGAGGASAAMLGALLAYNGWATLSSVAGEVRRPQRNLPLALICGVLVVIVLYIALNLAFFYALDPNEMASLPKTTSVAVAVGHTFIGDLASRLLAAVLVISTLGTLHISTLSPGRALYAMAADGLFFSRLGRISTRTRVPISAIAARAAWAIVLVLFADYDSLTDYFIFTTWIFAALGGAAIFILRRTQPDLDRPYRALGYPFVPALYVAVAGWLVVNTAITRPRASAISLAVLALGLPAYHYWARRTPRAKP